MKIFDPKKVTVALNGVNLTDFADGADVIAVTNNQDAGSWTMGADGRGVFGANPDNSGKLVLKIKQHSVDNKYLSDLFRQQKGNIATFKPFHLVISDLINGDVVEGYNGFFTTPTGYTRGAGINAQTWTLEFESLDIKLEKGF